MTYTVAKGDTLSSIASKLGVDWKTITGFRSGNPNLIYVGEVLNVPDKAKTTTQRTVVVAGGGGTPAPTTQTPASRPDLPNTVVRDGKTYVKQFDPNTNQFTYVLAKNQPTGTPTQSFGDLNKPTAPVAGGGTSGGGTGGTGSGTVLASGNTPMQTTATITGVPAATDIDPNTGKMYGINPSTGVWDDNYYANVFVPAWQAKLSSTGLTSAEQSALSGVYSLKYSDYEKKALEELTPYYDRLLKESNYDLDLAKTRLEEDYQKGLRVARQESDVDKTELFGTTLPQELRTTLGALNQGGMLTTAAPAPTPLKTTLSTGEEKTVFQPAGFGGQAGLRLAELRTSQQARQDAIERALKNAEETATIDYTRGAADIATSKSRTSADIAQKKTEALPGLAASKYQRALQEAQLKRDAILQRTGGTV